MSAWTEGRAGRAWTPEPENSRWCGCTAIVHGEYTPEESSATAPQVTAHDGAKYLIVGNVAEAEVVCDFIARRPGSLSDEAFTAHFRRKATPGFEPDRDLRKVGMANQTTMLANESLAIAARIHAAMAEGLGEAYARE